MKRRIQSETFLALGAMVVLLCLAVEFVLVDAARFESLPNHLRLALLFPVTWGALLICVPTLLDWKQTPPEELWRPAAVLVTTVAVHLASLAWWLVAPDARS